jgi:serine/threonine protein kinase
MSLQPGTKLGPYQIGEPLGAGGMGEVYRARDTRLDRTIAIKVMPAHLSAIRELRERFEREARTISSLNHPHICALYDVGSQDGVDFLVMEYLEGQTLADRLGTVSRTGFSSAALPSRALKLEEALTIAWQIADALDEAHRRGVVHRDLKPGNIMLTSSGAKLLDFGLAKQAGPAVMAAGQSLLQTSEQPLTTHGAVLGTFQYMAPEQLERREADARTDVFAFGTVLYEMVTGRRAFEGQTQVSLIAAIVDHDPPPVSSLQPVSPPLLDHVVKTCLEKNPDGRWQSMADVALQLRAIIDSRDARESDAAPARVVRKLRAMQLTAAALALALALAVGTRWYFSEAPRPARLQFDLPIPPATSLNQFAVSPDGKYIVSQANVGGSTLWVASLERGTGQALTGVTEAQWPFWSPDGRFLGYFSGGKLKRVDLAGGALQTIADSGIGAGASWNRDDIIVFAPDPNNALFRVSASGGTPTQLTTLDKSRDEFSHRHPHFLPDGRHFLYVAVSRLPEQSAVFAGSIDSPERTELVRSAFRAVFASPDSLLFMSDDGTTLMAQSFDPSRRQLADEPYIVAENLNTFAANSAAGFSASTRRCSASST